MSAGLRLRELLERLVAREIRFVLVGGLAVNAWGYVRGTQDVDLVPDPAPENLDRLAGLLVELGGRIELGEGQLDADAVEVDLDGTVVRVCSLDSLLAMKACVRAGARP